MAYQCLKGDIEKRPLMDKMVTKLESALIYQVSFFFFFPCNIHFSDFNLFFVKFQENMIYCYIII